jgi:cytidylate kinase
MIITVDGPAGSGKSSAAKALAQRLGFEYLDTGAMYRAVTLAALRAGVETAAEDVLADLVIRLQVEVPPGRVLLDGEDVTDLVRAAAVTAASGRIADSPAVRRRLGELQRRASAGRNMVCEGRDQGTIVFPDAICKFFLMADPAERARRRQKEMAQRGEVLALQEVLTAQEERDRRDLERDLAPMVPAPDAILLDSTHLSLEEVVDSMEREVRRRTSAC